MEEGKSSQHYLVFQKPTFAVKSLQMQDIVAPERANTLGERFSEDGGIHNFPHNCPSLQPRS